MTGFVDGLSSLTSDFATSISNNLPTIILLGGVVLTFYTLWKTIRYYLGYMFVRGSDEDNSKKNYRNSNVLNDRNVNYRELYRDMYNYTKSDTTYREFCDYYNYTPGADSDKAYKKYLSEKTRNNYRDYLADVHGTRDFNYDDGMKYLGLKTKRNHRRLKKLLGK